MPGKPELGRRASAVLRRMDGYAPSEVSSWLDAARSSVYRWAGWYREGGLAALAADARGRPAGTVSVELIAALGTLLETTPQRLSYLRSRWSSELLALVLRERHGLTIHASTLRRLLGRLNFAWRRARPTLHRRDPARAEKLAAIARALDACDAATPVLFVDEADLDLNPRIGHGWRRRGRAAQEAVPTPGQNAKHYLTGALHARSGKLVWVEHPRNNTALFIKLLEALRRTYRRARRIVPVLDNYAIHKSHAARAWLADNPKFELRFQPVYHPWVNRIERLWKAMHDTVTRNHRCATFPELCRHVARFLEVVQPFPGSGHGVAQLGTVI